jgi:nicotinamidase-related amidase
MEQTNNTALLVMDVQLGTLGRLQDTSVILKNVAKAIAKARSQKIPVIYVTVGFRPGTPEIGTSNKIFAAAKERLANADINEYAKIHPDIAPLAGEITTTKRRISAFTGSDLEVILRAHGIRHIVLTGIATSGVVLSTTCEASDKDYRITILSDCCADGDEEMHRVLTTKVFPRVADVITVEQWSKS